MRVAARAKAVEKLKPSALKILFFQRARTFTTYPTIQHSSTSHRFSSSTRNFQANINQSGVSCSLHRSTAKASRRSSDASWIRERQLLSSKTPTDTFSAPSQHHRGLCVRTSLAAIRHSYSAFDHACDRFQLPLTMITISI